ncbi:MAG TPA: sigma-70 family RNA polymerase sigma factor [Pirellulaceae bacterium]|nr:sigma-70 family RNA polymerase sigma factor [Pirellulaceae bacterium]HMO90706.1 sigma-70 family RNA polymerase sigma factor [Pirellulaceae bacterium]HMP71425.1 sigma-70 family RNA polymerase sigma factor [Pirellulaceae bacterium]
MDRELPRHDTDETSSNLIRLVKQMDQTAWHRLVDLYGPLVFSWCRRRGLDEERASEVTQRVFASVVKSIPRFQHGRPDETFRGWLRVITRNEVAMYYRQCEHCSELQVDGMTLEAIAQDDFDETSADIASESRELFLRAFSIIESEFEESTRQSFWMLVIDQRPVDVVAEALGLSAGAVRQAKYRVLKRLRDEFGDAIQ